MWINHHCQFQQACVHPVFLLDATLLLKKDTIKSINTESQSLPINFLTFLTCPFNILLHLKKIVVLKLYRPNNFYIQLQPCFNGPRIKGGTPKQSNQWISIAIQQMACSWVGKSGRLLVYDVELFRTSTIHYCPKFKVSTLMKAWLIYQIIQHNYVGWWGQGPL